MKILIAEDDPMSLRMLELVLEKEGHNVISVRDGEQALSYFGDRAAPSLAILDVLMPGMDGVEVCRRIRQKEYEISPYIILLTVKGAKGDIVEGLKAGADDYMVKPFDHAELVARVSVGQKIVKLQQKLAARVKELEDALSRVRHLQGLLKKDTQVYEFGPFRLEAAERRLLREGRAVPLTAKVFDLLLLLVQNSNHLVGKDEIMTEIWHDSEVEDNNLTVSMSVLRKTLGDAGGTHEYIETVPKRGYRFVAEVKRFKE